MAPADVNQAAFGRRTVELLDQKAFDIKLLDIDKRRLPAQRMALLLAQVEGVDLIASRKGAAYAPLHAPGRDALVNAQALENFQAFLGIADAARGRALHAHGVVLVQQHGAHAVLRQRAGQREPGNAAAHDGDGVAFDLARAQLRRLHKRVFGQGITRALGEFIAVGEGGGQRGGHLVGHLHCLRHGSAPLVLFTYS